MDPKQTDHSHRKRVKHFHTPGELHELTFSCYQRRRLLTNNDWRRRLSRSIDAAGKETSIQLVAFVFMPEHVHLLVYPTHPEPKIDFYLARLKQRFSVEIKALLDQAGRPLLKTLTVQERPGKTCFRFWQEGAGFDRNISEPEDILVVMDYFHCNPVKRRFVQRAVDWKWSSARFYLGELPRQQDPDLPRIAGLPSGALDSVRG